MTDTIVMKTKFTVIKNDDLDILYLTKPQVHREFERALHSINDWRKKEGKSENQYIVINTDESYVDEIIAILKQNGHWS